MKRFLSTLLLVTVSVLAYGAEEKAAPKAGRSAVEEFKARTQEEMAKCSAAAFKVPRGGSELEVVAASEPKKACIIAGRANARSAFPDALKQVSGNPAASKLLEEYFTYWLASFDNVGQAARESLAQYEKRTADERSKLDALWKRFKKASAKKK